MQGDGHGHVLAICRHCGNPAVKFVGPTMQACREHLVELPNIFYRDERLRQVDMQRVDDDLYRAKLNSHDILIFTMECDEEFEICYGAYQQALFMASMANNLQKVFEAALGEDFDPQKALEEFMNRQQPTNPEPPRPPTIDRSMNILSQLDLPEDFLSH